MTQVTVRSVDEAWVAKAKAEAARRGVSMNQVLLEALARGLDVKSERIPKTNIDRFAGDSDFGPGWDEFLDNRIDSELWTWSSSSIPTPTATGAAPADGTATSPSPTGSSCR